jgi:hypothetical protein
MSLSKKQSSENSKQVVVSNESEEERLLRKINRSDMEKFCPLLKCFALIACISLQK